MNCCTGDCDQGRSCVARKQVRRQKPYPAVVAEADESVGFPIEFVEAPDFVGGMVAVLVLAVFGMSVLLGVKP